MSHGILVSVWLEKQAVPLTELGHLACIELAILALTQKRGQLIQMEELDQRGCSIPDRKVEHGKLEAERVDDGRLCWIGRVAPTCAEQRFEDGSSDDVNF